MVFHGQIFYIPCPCWQFAEWFDSFDGLFSEIPPSRTFRVLELSHYTSITAINGVHVVRRFLEPPRTSRGNENFLEKLKVKLQFSTKRGKWRLSYREFRELEGLRNRNSIVKSRTLQFLISSSLTCGVHCMRWFEPLEKAKRDIFFSNFSLEPISVSLEGLRNRYSTLQVIIIKLSTVTVSLVYSFLFVKTTWTYDTVCICFFR